MWILKYSFKAPQKIITSIKMCNFMNEMGVKFSYFDPKFVTMKPLIPLHILILICSTIIMISCSKDRCNEVVEGPTYHLQDSSENYIQNYSNSFNWLNSGKVVFKERDDDEITFDVDMIKIYLPYSRSIPCEENTSEFNSQNGESEMIQVSLDAPEYRESIIIRVNAEPGVDPTVNESDKLFLTYGNENGPREEWDPLMIHYIGANLNYSVIKDSIHLNGKTYYNVIEVNPDNPGFNEPFNPPFEVKYTKELGIIYLHDKINDRELFYDRIE